MSEMVKTSGMVKVGQEFPIIQFPGRPPFMLDRDVAEFYGVTTRDLNKARSNNPQKFPGQDFAFQLTETEAAELVENFHRFESLKHSSVLPFAYPKKGAYMFATILKSDQAIEMALRIVEGFIAFEHAGEKVLPPGHVAVQAEKMIDLQQIYIERLELQAAGFGPRRGLPWSEADIQKIFAMKAKGKSPKSIGEHFGRSKEAVDKIVKKHKQRFAADADERRQELLFD